MKRVRWPRNFCKKKRKRKATGTVLSIHASLGRQPAAKLSSHFSLSLFSFFPLFPSFLLKKEKRGNTRSGRCTHVPLIAVPVCGHKTIRLLLLFFFTRFVVLFLLSSSAYCTFAFCSTEPDRPTDRKDKTILIIDSPSKKTKKKNVTTI